MKRPVLAVARNSIGTPQLKSNAVTSGKVRNGSLTAKDLGANALKAGPRGPRGQIGPAGRVQVLSDGQVVWVQGATDPVSNYTSLEGISFDTD
jgi:hypothetical protein